MQHGGSWRVSTPAAVGREKGTTIVTFLMVFLIQDTHNRDARALHLELDELIRSVHAAHNEMISIEKLSDVEFGGAYETIRPYPRRI